MRAQLARVLLTVALVAAAAGAPASAQDQGPVAITDIRQESNDRSTRLIVECNGALAYTYYSPDPLTLVVDIPGVEAGSVPSRINVGTREVESLRLTQMARADGRSIARLEVRLASLVPYQIYSKDRALNLVFERGAQVARAAEPPPVSVAEVPAPAPVAEAPRPAPEPPATHPAPRAESAPLPARKMVRATQIVGVTPGEEDGRLTLTVRADGQLRYQDFFLGNPDRLVVDFRDVVSRAPVRTLDVQREPVKAVRIGQFSAGTPKVARLVLDLSERKPYRIVEGADGLKIVFGEGRTPSPAPLAAMTPASAETAIAPKVVTPAVMPAIPDPPQAAPAPKEAPAQAATGEMAVKKWSGHPVSLDFKDGDLQDVFRLFADISGLNVVVNPGITGKVTLKLTEVPWDQALDLILKINGLGYAIEDNVLRIARLDAMQREEDERRKLAESKALAGDLVPWTRELGYATGAEIADVMKKAGVLSARGQLNIDARTNTILMNDLPSFVSAAKALVDQLDRATPQVEIEARVVTTGRNFSRELGIQWGFNQINSPRYGNTTGLTFPNAVVVNGGMLAPGAATAIGGDVEGIGGNSTGRGYAVNLPAGGYGQVGISLGNVLGNFNIDAVISAAETRGKARLLSSPKITTLNNKEATIKQGKQVPYQTVANNTVTTNFKDAALVLKVTPQISPAGTVQLKISIENNTIDDARSTPGAPAIQMQSAETNVMVADGATAVIGGVALSTWGENSQRVPFLSDIPIVGKLFRNNKKSESNDELLVFVTPRIVKATSGGRAEAGGGR
jgi:type IV pilus assembly protein PilQ